MEALIALVQRFAATAAPDRLLVHATIEILRLHYTTRNNNQLYFAWDVSDPKLRFRQIDMIDRLLRHLDNRLGLLLETGGAGFTDEMHKTEWDTAEEEEDPDAPGHGKGQAVESRLRLQQQQQLKQRTHSLFVVDDIAAFQRVSQALGRRSGMFDQSGYYTVVVTDPSGHGHESATSTILTTLWAHYIVNVVVLVAASGSNATSTPLYTYFPYGERHCEQVRPILWNVFDLATGGFVHRKRSLFPPKLHNFFGCQLSVASFSLYPFIIPKGAQLEGMEGSVLRTLAQRLSFRPRVIMADPPEWGIPGPLPENATGAAGMVRRKEVNFTIGYWATTKRRNRFMANSFSYYTSQIVLAVPPGRSYGSLEKLRFPFQPPTWALVVGSLLVGTGVICGANRSASPTVRRLLYGRADPGSNGTVLLGLIGIFLGGTLTRTTPPVGCGRILVLLWLSACLVLRNAYTSSMYNFLKTPRNATTPDTLNELLAANYRLYMYRNYSFIFDAFPQVRQHCRLVTAGQFRGTLVHELQQPGARLAVLLPIETLTYLNRNLSRDGQLLRIGKQRVYVPQLALYCPQASPLIRPFNHELEHYTASGLISRWAAQYHQLQFLLDPYEAPAPDQRVSLTNMSGCFVLLLVGYAISTVVYVGELRRATKLRAAEKRIRVKSKKTLQNQ
ncbi:uncharacterized protein LOC125952083 [Anopheles darlingi]|uniref:uncharacterized protein LOC125952083 n=1 Tax=Anopheles darlingi TaxID=43151 RepID=UPI0021001F25|nr:uncharacterized protein LOC125952083 [Anopheles darlingi]